MRRVALALGLGLLLLPATRGSSVYCDAAEGGTSCPDFSRDGGCGASNVGANDGRCETLAAHDIGRCDSIAWHGVATSAEPR